jgi:phage tail sheath protein FI
MPEYLAPGVYVEETSFRAKSIEGVATSTAGFVGRARFGPIEGLPVLVTSFEDFQRRFGDSSDLILNGVPTTNHLAHAVRLFFENGGKRVYVARVIEPSNGDFRARSEPLIVGNNKYYLRARYPGMAGNLQVHVNATRSSNLLVGEGGTRRLMSVRLGDLVEVSNTPKERSVKEAPVDANNLYAVSFDANGQAQLSNKDNDARALNSFSEPAIQKISIDLIVKAKKDGSSMGDNREDVHQQLSSHPDSDQFIGTILRQEDAKKMIEPPTDRSQRIFFDLGDAEMPSDPKGKAAFAQQLLDRLLMTPVIDLNNGSDGGTATGATFTGGGEGPNAKGLKALEEIDDIAIIAAPGSAALPEADAQEVTSALISQCENLRYRFAILAGPADADESSIRQVRGKFDSKYAAFYYPWLVINPPGRGLYRNPIQLSPEGAVAGIYARSDIERGVHKAPANETVRGILRFSRNVTKGQQDVLNPEGVNCLRFFEGRGYRVWGARTISSDPEWTYLNVRRLFIYLEHSIDRSTQWAVFEPNNDELWLKIRLTIEGFLYDEWKKGALLGRKPEEAYFVRCDRSTMSQSDLDNGRLICLIGVAPTKPAEFVIFRIGQWTADASIL